MGTSKFMILVPLFDLKFPGFISPLAVHGFQIGGTNAADPAPVRIGYPAGLHGSPQMSRMRPCWFVLP
jgi:hypothetical protein